MTSSPSHEQQATFFAKLQYLLTEGEFVSTYKYALLIALSRWAVEHSDHDESLPLHVSALAEHFLALYWPQARPFRESPSGSELRVAEPAPHYGMAGDRLWDSILVQDRGGQRPRILKKILTEHELGHGQMRSLPEVRRRRLLSAVAETIRTMPLWKLHSINGDERFRFLYRQGADNNQIQFEPGMVACLAAFAPLIEHIVRAAWLQFVLRCNKPMLGSIAQVEDFLFPDGRSGLSAWRPILSRFQGDRCFYCDAVMRHEGDVDHFLPWARYPRDLGHNFVLAHPKCNADKSDHLASVEHLERWCRRNEESGSAMVQAFDAARLPHDWPTLRRVAGSLYRIAANANARVWHRGKEFAPLSGGWQRLLGAG